MSHRTQITLTDGQYKRLSAESHQRGVPLAELIRRAVDRTYGSHDGGSLLAALDDSFGGWQDAEDGADHVEALRTGLARRLADRAG